MDTVILSGKNGRFAAFLRQALGTSARLVTAASPAEAIALAAETGPRALFLLPDYDTGSTWIDEFDDSTADALSLLISRGSTFLYLENYPAYDYRDCYVLGIQSLGFQRRIGTDSIRLSDRLAEELGFTLLQKRLGCCFPGFNRASGENELIRIRNCTGTHRPITEAARSVGCGLMLREKLCCAMFDLSCINDFATGPYAHWQKLYGWIFSRVLSVPAGDVEESFARTWPPIGITADFRLRRTGEQRKTALEQAVRRAVNWHLCSGILPAKDGSRGVYEMIRSLDLAPAKNIRGDASLFTAALFAAAGETFGVPEWTGISETLTAFTLEQRKLQITEGDNRGLFKWFAGTGELGTKTVFSSDCGRVGMNLLGLCRIRKDPALLAAAEDLGEAFLRWFGGYGLLPGAGFLDYEKESVLALQKLPHTLSAPEYYESVMIFLRNLWQLTGDERYRAQILRTAGAMAERYPDYQIGAALSRGFTESRLLGIFVCAQTFENGPWTPLIGTLLDRFSALQQDCGGIAESQAYSESQLLRLNVGLGGTAQAEEKDEAKEVLEFAVGFGGGHDCIADLMYCCNTLLAALSILECAEDPGPWSRQRLRDMRLGLTDFLLNIQIVSDDPRIDGGWMRAFDMEVGEYFGCARDIAWGSGCILTGWVTGCLPLCFLEQLGCRTVYLGCGS